MTTTDLVTLPFMGDDLTYIVRDGEQFVVVRPICEALGLAWQVQHRKLTSGDRPWCVQHMVTQMAGDDQNRTVVCLPLFMLPAWLFSVSPAKVRPDLKDKLIAYQAECAEVLYRHFILGDQAHPGLVTELARLRRMNGHLSTLLLVARPLWNRLMRCHDAGFGWYNIMRLLNLSEPKLTAEWDTMEACGLVPGVSEYQRRTSEALLAGLDTGAGHG